MKKLHSALWLSLCLLCCSVMSAQAALKSFDFNSLTPGVPIPLDGIELDGVSVFSATGEIFNISQDPNNIQNVIAVWPGMVVFTFSQSLFVNEITATIGSNAAPALLQVFGTQGSASFSTDGPWDQPVTQTFKNLGEIHTVLFSGFESFISGLDYNTADPVHTPIPGAALLLGSGVLGLASLSRRKSDAVVS